MTELTEQQKKEQEIREFYEERKGDVSELVPAKVRVSKTPRTVFSLRLAAEELTELMEAAQQHGVTVSDFIRSAALDEARRQNVAAKGDEAALEELRGQFLAMGGTIDRLTRGRGSRVLFTGNVGTTVGKVGEGTKDLVP